MIQFMQDIYDGMKSFMVGMKVTGSYLKNANLHEKETVTTIDYDGSMAMARDVKLGDRFRGHLHNDIERCIVCHACSKACPIDCFWIDGEKSETNKLRPSRFDIDLLKCMYCGLCVFACPTGCLTMTKEWWGSTFAGDGKNNLHGQLKQFGVGYYSQEQKLVIERKRIDAAEARKKAAAAAVIAKAAAAKVAEEAKRKAAEAAATVPATTATPVVAPTSPTPAVTPPTAPPSTPAAS